MTTTDSPDRRGRDRGANAGVLTLAQLEEVRLLLRGGSVVDWYRLNFETADDVRRYTQVLEIDLDDPDDAAVFEVLRGEAKDYLESCHSYRLPDELMRSAPLDLFLYASERKGRRKDRLFACLLLKVMHIIHHIRARELRYLLPLAESELSQFLIKKVTDFADAVRNEGFPLTGFSGGEKSTSSVVTKLLVKREHHAAAVRDRVRFRFVVERDADLVPLLHRMCERIVPFNYVVPGHTQNDLVNFTALIESHESYRQFADDFQVEFGHEEQSLVPLNEFSGPTYRAINFVADVPLRVPALALPPKDDIPTGAGGVIFSLAEFQVVDKETDDENEAGENSHDRYKERQIAVVRERLERGLRDTD